MKVVLLRDKRDGDDKPAHGVSRLGGRHDCEPRFPLCPARKTRAFVLLALVDNGSLIAGKGEVRRGPDFPTKHNPTTTPNSETSLLA